MTEFSVRLIRSIFPGMDGGAKLTGSDMSAHMPTLYLLARNAPGPIVECGVGKGFSTVALLAGAIDDGLHLTSYDFNQRCEETAFVNMGFPPNDPWRNVIRQSWTFVREDSVKAAALWADQSIGLWFLDTSHRYGNTSRELDAWFPKIQSNGVMCGHDYLLEGAGVQKAVDEFVAKYSDKFRLQVCRYDQGLFILWPR